MRRIVAFGSGILFGIGLILADMVNPARVRAFLDIFGEWDLTLAFVMIGGIAVSTIAWIIVKKRDEAVLGGALPGPASKVIDRKLILGSMIFGIGWGLVGVCPGPAITALTFGGMNIVIFVIAMAVGMIAFQKYSQKM